jgi:hypothetical protein
MAEEVAAGRRTAPRGAQAAAPALPRVRAREEAAVAGVVQPADRKAVAAAPSRRSHLAASILAVSGSRSVSFLRRAAIASSSPLPPLCF